ncbi:MAG: family 10 glycosylhydrolase [Thermoanaerobaculia bacterium]
MRNLSLAVLALLVLATSAEAQPRSEYRGYWVETFNSQLGTRTEIDRVIQNCVASNCNAIFPQVRRRGDSWYLNSLEPLTEVANVGEPATAGGAWTIDPLQYLIDQAHLRGIEVHAFVIVTAIYNAHPTITGVPKNPNHVFLQHFFDNTTKAMYPLADPRQWATRALPHNQDNTTFDGQRFVAEFVVDLGHPDAEAYTVSVFTNLVQKYNVDGIHLDRIRYPDAPLDRKAFQYYPNDGYNETNVARFKARFPAATYYQSSDVGKQVSDNPVKLLGTGDVGYPRTDDPQWLQWRRDQVTNFVRRLYLSVTAVRPRVKVSAALICSFDIGAFPGAWTNGEPYRRVFQDWDAWTREGILDLVCPMAYKREHVSAERLQFDHWSDYAKALTAASGRQAIIGQGVYLNAIEGSLPQTRRALALPPNAAGTTANGVLLYALGDTRPNVTVGNSTNASVTTNPLSYPTPGVTTPKRTNTEFFSALKTGAGTTGALFESTALTPVFRDEATIPPMPWKESPTRGHLRGFAFRADGVSPIDTGVVTIENVATGATRTTTTDGGGFFGGVSLDPGSYRAKVTLGGDVAYACVASVGAGLVTSSDARLELRAPVTSPTQSASGWTNQNVTLSLSSTDDCTGVVATETSVNSGATWQPYSGAMTFTSEGTTTVQFRSRDWAGNVETTKSTAVQIDKTSPVIAISAPTEGARYLFGQSVAAVYDCTDALSGIADCSVATIDTSSIGVKTFTVSARDVAGNTTSRSVSYRVVAPTVTTLTSSEAAPVYGQPVTFSVSVTSAAGVPGGTVDLLDGSTTLSSQPLSGGTFSFTTSALGAGTHNLHAEYRGADDYLPSSATLTQGVDKAATQISFSYEEDRNRVILIATVTAVAPGAGTPTGTVTFTYKHGDPDSAPLIDGKASNTVQKRSYQLTLTYSGSANYLPVTSEEIHFEPRPSP